MIPLLSLAQQQAIKHISPNWAAKVKDVGGTTNYDQLAVEVEESKLMLLLGVALFQDVQENPTSETNLLILDGGEFSTGSGNTIKFKGARYILAYYNYSQLVSESYVSDTYTGFVKKDRNETATLSSSERKELKISAENNATAQWELLRQFLNKNAADYPLWHVAKSKSPRKPRLTGIRRTVN